MKLEVFGLIASLAIALSVSACGSGDDSGGGGAAGAAGGGAGASGSAGSSAVANVVDCSGQTIAQTVEMTATLTFNPATASVGVGEIVKFDNAGTVTHTATSGKGGVTPVADGKWNTGNVAAGASACVEFLVAGSYGYYCAFHPSTMQGTITVQ